MFVCFQFGRGKKDRDLGEGIRACQYPLAGGDTGGALTLLQDHLAFQGADTDAILGMGHAESSAAHPDDPGGRIDVQYLVIVTLCRYMGLQFALLEVQSGMASILLLECYPGVGWQNDILAVRQT
ncbi:hypothetical protein A8U91_02011 [Halomonas elongata]|uniref:Uncharacterized protein n=1 Tax=Halomonas elongata TaxID=2746 RepID=A0A1B8P5U1_HALEL|nr:hypothetical protein A8U91_02011 [Halomonas elongata]